MKPALAAAIALLGGLFLNACGDDDGDAAFALVKADRDRAPAEASDAGLASQAGADLGFAVLREMPDEGQNRVISPYSIQVALAMTRLGARGVTREEMDRVLGAEGVEAYDASLNALDQVLLSRSGTFEIESGDEVTLELSTANSLWGQDGVSFLDEFLDPLAEWYGAGMRLVDYASAAEEARDAINGWVSEQTRERIPELIPAGAISPSTVLVITNAVYLNAPWLFPFPEAKTEQAAFTRLDGSQVQAAMMQQATPLSYAEGDGFAAVELPYAGSGLAMLLVVPGSGEFERVEDALDAEMLERIIADLEEYEVTLAMPRFEFRTQAQLNDVLSELGMPTAFGPEADFSGMTPEAALYISAVLHEAFISVDELGTEAAAATAVILDESAVGQHADLRIDRPFLFFIRDTATGAILFAGRVTDPTAD